MNSNNVIFFPSKLTENSLVILNYLGSLNDTENKVFIEYSYTNFENNTTVYKSPLSPVHNYSVALIFIKKGSTFTYRFKDSAGNIDDNNGSNYQVDITPSFDRSNYVVPNRLLNDSVVTTTALVPTNEFSAARKGLRLSYKLNKKIKIISAKIFRKLPNFLKGDYRRRLNI